jgi:hypothetical protein
MEKLKKIAIFGVPRSGTSWLSELFDSHPDVIMRFQPLFSYGHKGALSEYSSNEEIERFYDDILRTTDTFVLMDTPNQINFPKFKKNVFPGHICFKETRYLHIIENMLKKSDLRVIGIIRNPLANLASWIKAPKEFQSQWDIRQEWREAKLKNQGKPEEFYGFNKWKQVASSFLEYAERYPSKFLAVTYANLNSNTANVLERLFAFFGLSMHEQVFQFIEDSKNRHDEDPYSVYRGKASDNNWRGIIPDDIIETIVSELQGTLLERFLDSSRP